MDAGLATSDPAAAEQFYTSLFGWEAEELSAGEAGTYTMLRRTAHDVAILYRQQPEARAAGAPPHWTSHISVEDADATAARAAGLGGAAVFREPFDVLDAGCVAASDIAGKTWSAAFGAQLTQPASVVRLDPFLRDSSLVVVSEDVDELEHDPAAIRGKGADR